MKTSSNQSALTAALLFGVLLVSLLGAGCSSTSITKWQQALAKDPATVTLRVTSIYGTANMVRIGGVAPGTSVTANPDGTVTVRGPALPPAAAPAPITPAPVEKAASKAPAAPAPVKENATPPKGENSR